MSAHNTLFIVVSLTGKSLIVSYGEGCFVTYVLIVEVDTTLLKLSNHAPLHSITTQLCLCAIQSHRHSTLCAKR